MSYDNNNVFAKILRGELPCNKIYEDDNVLAFHTIEPMATIHGLVIPKAPYKSYNEFIDGASPEEVVNFFKGVDATAKTLGIKDGGYKLSTNIGEGGGQEVPHLHFHLMAGKFKWDQIEKVKSFGVPK